MSADEEINSEDARELADDLVGQSKRAKQRRERKGNGDAGQARRRANILTLVTFLDEQPAWRDAVRFNELTQNIEVAEPFPPRAGPRTMRPLREPGDLLEAVMWVQGNGYPQASKSVVWDALCAIASRNLFHPVRDYLNALRWDGEARVHNLFVEYFCAALPPQEGAPPDQLSPRDRLIAYLEHIARCFMVGAVARIMCRDGCKLDNVPVMVGAEGLNKSMGLAALCPDAAWFSDDLSPDLVQRDTKESLAGKWIIELSEMPHARKEVERVKAFFSRKTDRYRRAYDRRTGDHPRQCVFVGTSNDLELISATGNRRFWPFEVDGSVDVEGIARDRDQLWAEAVELYRQGKQYWLDPEIEAFAVEQQEAFGEDDLWLQPIAQWIDARQPGDEPFMLADVFKGCLGFADTTLVDKRAEARASACLKKLGYRSRRRRYNGQRAHWWTRRVSRVSPSPKQ